jgi:diaminohydroxyphosphoribosylaminopyrimidine deaminase/5-amino-6-(5-phosphoribosylamino)uracil reductase
LEHFLAGAMDSTDRELLEKAILLGRRGWGRVHPNPMVGCVLVKDGLVVGEGWHEEFGGPHAEANALAGAREGAEGATAYVSLEPCNHYGHTPPCSLALRDAGIARVVYGAPDPGSESGGGGRTLQEAGVEVTGPVLSQEEAMRETRPSLTTCSTAPPSLP